MKGLKSYQNVKVILTFGEKKQKNYMKDEIN